MDANLEVIFAQFYGEQRHTSCTVQITIQDPVHYVPLFQDIQECLKKLRRGLDSNDICLYWRFSDKRFLPIYDFVTYSAAVALMAERRLYLVVRDGPLPDQEAHPRVTGKSRTADEELLAALYPAQQRGAHHLGYTIDEAARTKEVLDVMKGVQATESAAAPTSASQQSKKKK